MSVLQELIDRRNQALEELSEVTRRWMDLGERCEALGQVAADCDKAIAALRTPEVETDTAQDRVEPLLDQGQSLPDQSSSQESETDPADLPLSDEQFNALEKLDGAEVIVGEPWEDEPLKPYDAQMAGLDASEEPRALIEDPIPEIPRSEIPEGIAPETFTEQGVETVKIGGLTHLVTDEPKPHEPHDDQPFVAARDGGDAGFWASVLARKKVDA